MFVIRRIIVSQGLANFSESNGITRCVSMIIDEEDTKYGYVISIHHVAVTQLMKDKRSEDKVLLESTPVQDSTYVVELR